MSIAVSKMPLGQLVAKWRRWAKADCSPANGSATAQARGRAFAECASELEYYLVTEGEQKITGEINDD
jgi:hypothetical protein